jgi:two-component system, cell cycle sensor histidine kinase and response regulator CckA
MKNKDTARILIVDDQIHALQGVSRIMRGAGYETFEASNGADCLRMAVEHKPDLILLDVVLPDIDGREVCLRIKSCPETSDIYVVLLSSIQVQSDSQAEALEHGADGYIARPLPNRELLARVKAILRLKFAENRLRENEERYRRISSLTSDIAYSCIKSNNTVYSIDWIMGAVERITGHSAEDIKALGWWRSLVIDEDRAIFDTRVVGIAPGSTGSCELRLCHKSGKIVWVSSLSECVLVSGTPDSLRLYGGLVDITERKQAEESLQRSEKFLEQVVENIPDMIFVKDAENLSFVRFNKAGEELLGYSREDLIGKSDYDFFPQSQAEFFIAKDREVLRNGKLVEIPEEEIDTRFKAKRTLHTKKIPILGADGNPRFLLGISEDITERKQSEEKNLRLATIVDSSDDAIISNTLDGIMTSWNKGAERIFGYKEHEVIGKSILILAPNDRKYEPEGFLKQIKSGRSMKNVETVLQRKDGANIPVSLTVSPIIDEKGGVFGASAIVRDISDHVKAEQQREALQSQFFQAQKMEAIGTLAGGFAHDFNNKLQVIDGYVDLMLFDKDLPETLKQDMRIIKQAVDSSAELIKGMMVFSRKTPIELQPIDLNKLVAQTGSILARSISKIIDIDLFLADDLWTVKGAPNQIDQILMNLAVNARDAMPDGGRLTIETKNIVLDEEYCSFDPLVKPGRYVLIEVSDTGTGMNKETASHVFEPFFTTKEEGKGTGLGLAVVYGIVEQHGARIICDSAPSVGTTFRIYFPAIEEAHEEQDSEKTEPPKGQGETILLVDDEPNLVVIVSRQLVSANYRVIKASNGNEALNLYEKHREEIRLVILDLLMPGMEGKQCLEALRKLDPNVRVLIATGHTTPGMVGELEQAGAKGFIRKPFETSQLLEEIRKIIDED